MEGGEEICVLTTVYVSASGTALQRLHSAYEMSGILAPEDHVQNSSFMFKLP